MKYCKILMISFFLLIFTQLSAQDSSPYCFVSPKPGSIMVSAETNIILTSADVIDRSTLSSGLITVRGSISGIHSGELILSDDEKTIVFNPDNKFTENEEVQVIMLDGIKNLAGENIKAFSFSFATANEGVVQAHYDMFDDIDFPAVQNGLVALNKAVTSSLPAPTITIDSLNNPSDGYIFLATWDRNVPAKYGNFIFILDKNGAIVDSVRIDGAPFDFQVQQNGLLTYALGDFSSNVPQPGEDLRYIVLDSTLAVVDTFQMKNGYTTDFHEFKMLPNGHVMMMSYHSIVYDMSKLVEGGKTDAELVINIIQEQDKDKNVVFEWRNIDYIPITDTDLDLTDSRINYGTLNAFDVDNDGNILASFRNHSEIMKISRKTGEIMWRMGGPRGEFTFIGEHEENAPYYHSRQHNIHRHKNGNITMFDNGQFHLPPYSRAVEYSIDEVNKTATLVSEWRYPNGNIFCVTAGNAQLMDDGGWFIGFGVPNPQFIKRNIVEVHPDGSIAFELSLPSGILAYRASKFPWKGSVNKQSFTNFEVKEGNTYGYNNETIKTGVEITYTALSAADYNESKVTRLPYGPVNPEFIDKIITVYPVSIVYEGLAINTQSADFKIDLSEYPEIKNPASVKVYHREFPGQGLFVPKSTTFNDGENNLAVTITSFGEIVFGVPDEDATNNTPILYEPLDKQNIVLQDTITIRWTGKGYYDSFTVQVSTDSTFATTIEDTSTGLSFLYLEGLSNNTEYFWRINSVLNGEVSQWSDVWSFNITDPYIINVVPGGGETWGTGKTEIIRWETNIIDNVVIDLLQEETVVTVIDTIPGSYLAYEWTLPESLVPGENYKIKVSSEMDGTVFGSSESVFEVADSITSVVEYDDQIPVEYNLAQNYPNPFNPATTIKFSIPEASVVKLKIYDMLGNEVAAVIDEYKAAGRYSVYVNAGGFASGVYVYRIIAGSFVDSKKMILLK